MKYLLFLVLALLGSVAHAVATPTAIPTSTVPTYWANKSLVANTQMQYSEYCFDAEVKGLDNVLMGTVGTHCVRPTRGMRVPYGAWVRSVVQGPTEKVFAEAATTPVADLYFGAGSAASAGGHNKDWLGVDVICNKAAFNDLASTGGGGDLADLGVNWWAYTGIADYDALRVTDPETLPVSFTVENATILTGRLRFIIEWCLPSTAFKH